MSSTQVPTNEDSGRQHYISPRKQRSKPKAKLQPPLTPMIDVTFLLLLYFLLTSTFRENEGQIPGSLPARGAISARQITPLKPIRISLIPRGPYNDKVIYQVDNMTPLNSPDELYKVLVGRKKAVRSNEVPVLIQVQPEVRWQYALEARNAVSRARFKNTSFVPNG